MRMSSLGRLLLTLVAALSLLGAAAGQTPRTDGSDGLGAPAASAPAGPPAPRPSAAAPLAPEVLQLRRDLEQTVRSSGSRSAAHSVLVVSLDRGDTLFSVNADLPLAPASNMKLFSTAAALYYLGPNFRYSTFALADGEVRDGALYGDVVLYGTGDPAISSRMLPGALPPLRALADSLVAHGVREIHGDVVGDGSYFDDAWIGEGWREEYRLASYSAPVGALSLAENIVSIRVVPGSAAGQPAEIRTTPSTVGLLVQNRVRTVAGGGSSVRFSYDAEGLVIEGQLARGHPGVARTVTVVDPANFAASAFRNVLEQAGVRVHGRVRTVRTPESSPVGRGTRTAAGDGSAPPPARVLGSHLSPPLAEIAAVTNHVSQNLFAEALFKTVGRVALGEGSFLSGSRAVQYFLECEQPVDFSTLNFVDGSGLSPLNRLTARATIHLLDLMTRTDVWETFYASLPEAASPEGGRHSLRGRMGGTPAGRNLRAKTGTISNVSSLSGYVRAANGELLAFGIFVNDVPSTWQAKRMEDAIGARLARFSRATEAEPVEPAPEADPEQPAGTEAETGAEAARRPEPSGPERARPAAAPPVPSASPAPPAVAPATRTHRVARGETLDGIARRYGTTVADLQRLNPGVQPRRLQIGQTLRVPG
jgi:serine-type D-Ala-D-Ala carboxypeptidase/endopeptidase (penicillin-binding protein 4)